MEEGDIQHIANHLEGVIERKVNGKIDKLSEEFQIHKEEMKPILEAYTSASNFGSFVVWISKIIIAVGVIVGMVLAITKLK